MIRATLIRALILTTALAGALTPVRCLGETGNQLPAKPIPELSAELLSLFQQKNMVKHSPILVRIFKEEAELEVWKRDTTGHFQLLKIYPICRWSGDLGPKLHEGDRQAPEGFYTITPALLNPNSIFYLAINTGFPNSFDKANDRDGSFLMIHGDCWSSGCYAMTDEQIAEIYSLALDSFLGRPAFQIQAYPSRSATIISRRRISNPRWMCAIAIMCSMRASRRIRRTRLCSIRPVNVPPLSSIRKSLGRRWRNNAPTRSNTRN